MATTIYSLKASSNGQFVVDQIRNGKIMNSSETYKKRQTAEKAITSSVLGHNPAIGSIFKVYDCPNKAIMQLEIQKGGPVWFSFVRKMKAAEIKKYIG